MGFNVKYQKVLPKTVLPLDKRDWQEIGQIVRLEAQNGIASQEQVDGTPYAPLKPETIRRKAAKGSASPSFRLIDTQNLWNNQKVTPSTDRVELTIGPTREAIAYGQQEVAPAKSAKGWRYTKFFGISENCSNRILAYVNMKVDKWLSRTN